MMIEAPYLLFLGEAQDPIAVKTARGVAQWRPENCVGEYSLEGATISLGLPSLSPAAATARGAKTFVLGLANAGGTISDTWVEAILEALEAGLDIASGLHRRLASVPIIRERAEALGRRLIDIRHSDAPLPVGNGKKRAGMRLLTVGTDCSVGKMYTTLALEQAMRTRGMDAEFRATGQTGILIAGAGLPIDAVVSDFISGAVEVLTPDAAPDHWDLIEGQGSLFHPSYAGVSLGLLHGAQADALVVCHEPDRPHMRSLPYYALPSLAQTIDVNLAFARRTNENATIVGVSLNTSSMTFENASKLCADTARIYGVPCVDPLRMGVDDIVTELEGFPRP
ncbi:N-acetyltransferase DgcN [Kordiimonas aestuarii]|uniref:N-acetyltransferase DgcN n=1 Tax=Kordiimonas aestuarii TaxID=1005925 RepID=UPI0021D3AC1F|nr:N-acetyltransferase DgcN [Kordiimonas aestuarii]